MKRFALLLLLLLATPAVAQQGGMIGPVSPCTAFGTTSGTCAQGNDSRITGAVQQSGVTPWTPIDGSGASLVFTDDGTNACNNTTHICASYTKIGNMVFAYGQITFPSTVSGSQAVVAGLPVTVANANYARGPCVILSTVPAISVQGDITGNSTNFAIVNAIADGTVTNVTLSTRIVRFSCVYPAQ